MDNYKYLDINWEQRRYEIAKQVLPTFIAYEMIYSDTDRMRAACKRAVAYADLLIEQLEKK